MNKYAVFYSSLDLSKEFPNGQRLTDAMSFEDAHSAALSMNVEYQDIDYEVRVVEANSKVERTDETIY